MKILLVGCGNMMGAMLKRWVGQPGIDRIEVITQSGKRECEYAPHPSLSFTTDWQQLSGSFDAVVVGVKPQSLPQVLPELKPHISEQTLVVSIAAGCTIDYFERAFGQRTPIIRSMPNLPSKIGKGLTGLVANPNATSAHQEQALMLFTHLGKTLWLDDESKMDAITAISGSGPGFIFLLMEYFCEAAIARGFDEQTAKAMILDTFSGSAQYAAHLKETSLSDLREAVTSKAGTTAAGLAVLQEESLIRRMIADAIAAAEQRGQELVQELEGSSG